MPPPINRASILWLRPLTLQKLLLPLSLLCLWWILGRSGIINSYLFPAPEAVFAAGFEGLINGELFRHAGVSLGRVFCGFTLTCFVALPLACSIAAWPLLERIISVPLEFIRIVPPLAAIPLLILWFGIGEGSKLALIVLASFFPVFLSTVNGLRNVDSKLLEMGASIDLSRWQQYRFITLPAALPMIITGLRLGFGYSWRALIGAELIAAASGLGYMILDAEELARTDRVFVGILLIGLLGYLFDMLFVKVASNISRRLGLSTGELR